MNAQDAHSPPFDQQADHFQFMSRPHISVNFAISLDGKITSVSGKPSGWTSREDHSRLKKLRESAQALLVSRGTLESDRMTLQAPQNPLRCVVSRSGNYDAGHPLFHSEGGEIHLLATESHPAVISGATLHQQSLADFIQTLCGMGASRIHCEGGGQLVRELAEMDLLDEIHLTWASHTLFGGREAPGICGVAGDFLPESRHFELTHFEPREDLGECFLSYRRRRE